MEGDQRKGPTKSGDDEIEPALAPKEVLNAKYLAKFIEENITSSTDTISIKSIRELYKKHVFEKTGEDCYDERKFKGCLSVLLRFHPETLLKVTDLADRAKAQIDENISKAEITSKKQNKLNSENVGKKNEEKVAKTTNSNELEKKKRDRSFSSGKNDGTKRIKFGNSKSVSTPPTKNTKAKLKEKESKGGKLPEIAITEIIEDDDSEIKKEDSGYLQKFQRNGRHSGKKLNSKSPKRFSLLGGLLEIRQETDIDGENDNNNKNNNKNNEMDKEKGKDTDKEKEKDSNDDNGNDDEDDDNDNSNSNNKKDEVEEIDDNDEDEEKNEDEIDEENSDENDYEDVIEEYDDEDDENYYDESNNHGKHEKIDVQCDEPHKGTGV
jgi:hypothetical protein